VGAVDKARKLLAAKTKGTWTWQTDPSTGELFLSFGAYGSWAGVRTQDAEFLCAAPAIIQELIDEIEALRSNKTNMRDAVEAVLEDENPNAFFADGFDDAIIGIVRRCGQPSIVGYDCDACVQILMDRDGMTHDEAVEFFEFNVLGAWAGDGTPAWIKRQNHDP
jgi:hypothetical protein